MFRKKCSLNLKEFFNELVELKNSGQQAKLSADQLEYFNPIDRVKLAKIKKQVERIHALKYSSRKKYRIYKSKKSFDGRRGYLLGLVFERLIQTIFKESLVFSLQPRVLLDTCEIDFFIHIIEPYNVLFSLLASHKRLHGEAKCHARPPEAEWVNLQAGKMVANDTRLGMIFTFHKPAPAPFEFRTAIKDHSRSNPPVQIIPWGPTLISDLLDGKSFLKLIQIQSNLAHAGTASMQL